MFRTLVAVIFCAAVSSAAESSAVSSPKNIVLLPQIPQTRSIFCDSCLKIVGAIDDIADEDTADIKKVIETLCDDIWSGFPPTYAAGCINWMDTDLDIIQLKIKNGWSPDAICKDFNLCA